MPAALYSQLALPQNQGLLVVAVMPEGPVAKAGVVRHDILWSVNGKPLSSPGDLTQTIESGKTGKVVLEVIRAGKRQTLEATPEKLAAQDV